MKILNVLLAVLVSLAVFAGVFEVGLRLIGMGPAKTLNQFDETVGWIKRADAKLERSTKEFEVTYALNEHGLRDDDSLTMGKTEGTTRVLALGDSFTLGFSVDREDLFVDQLETWWQREGRQVEVINAGTEGYSTDQEAAWLAEYGSKWQPDLVLVFAYENDLFYNGQDRYLAFPKPRYQADGERRPPVRLEEPRARPRTAIGNLLADKVAPETFQPPGATQPIPKEFGPLLKETPALMAAAREGTQGALRALRATAQELDAELVVFVIPSRSAVEDGFLEVIAKRYLGGMPLERLDPHLPAAEFRRAAETAGVRLVDATEGMRSAQAASEDPLYYHQDFHLTPAGNRAFAQFVHSSLHELGLAPGQGKVIPALPTDLPRPKTTWWPTWLSVFLTLWAIVGSLYNAYYRDEKVLPGFLKVGALLGVVFAIALGAGHGLDLLPPQQARVALILALLVLFGFIFYKLGDRLGTITELCGAFILRGHWYLMPLVMILLSVGSLLVVAASSPLVAPFIYTLF